MSAKKPKAPKVPELPPPPAITDPRVQEAETSDRLARRRGAMAAVFAGRTNRMTRPTMNAADSARAAARAQRARGASADGVQQTINDASMNAQQQAIREALRGIAGIYR